MITSIDAAAIERILALTKANHSMVEVDREALAHSLSAVAAHYSMSASTLALPTRVQLRAEAIRLEAALKKASKVLTEIFETCPAMKDYLVGEAEWAMQRQFEEVRRQGRDADMSIERVEYQGELIPDYGEQTVCLSQKALQDLATLAGNLVTSIDKGVVRGREEWHPDGAMTETVNLIGRKIPDVYNRFVGGYLGPYGISNDEGSTGMPGMRFVSACLNEMEIYNRGRPYAMATILEYRREYLDQLEERLDPGGANA
jgi:hypothetical protein